MTMLLHFYVTFSLGKSSALIWPVITNNALQSKLKGNVNLISYSNWNKQSRVSLGELKVINRNFCKEQICTKHSSDSWAKEVNVCSALVQPYLEWCVQCLASQFKKQGRSMNVSWEQKSWWKGWECSERRLRALGLCCLEQRGWGVISLLSAAS